jgi:hypothetical protein
MPKSQGGTIASIMHLAHGAPAALRHVQLKLVLDYSDG